MLQKSTRAASAQARRSLGPLAGAQSPHPSRCGRECRPPCFSRKVNAVSVSHPSGFLSRPVGKRFRLAPFGSRPAFEITRPAKLLRPIDRQPDRSAATTACGSGDGPVATTATHRCIREIERFQDRIRRIAAYENVHASSIIFVVSRLLRPPAARHRHVVWKHREHARSSDFRVQRSGHVDGRIADYFAFQAGARKTPKQPIAGIDLGGILAFAEACWYVFDITISLFSFLMLQPF